jgi:putative tricarboxylic transport membrane protein
MRPNAVVGIAAILWGIAYSWQAWELPRAMIGNPLAPVLFPLGLGILFTALGILLFAQEARKGLRNLEGVKVPKFDRVTLGYIGGTSLICVIYAAVLEHVTFIPATLFFSGALLFFINRSRTSRTWAVNLILTLGFSFGGWYVFEKLFQINLP